MSKSVLQQDKTCYVCGTYYNLHKHHCLYGNKRKKADEYGYTVYLCYEHHEGQSGVHMNPNKGIDLMLKQLAQLHFEKNYGDREQFIKEFGKSYL